jgi:hypothetical protein
MTGESKPLRAVPHATVNKRIRSRRVHPPGTVNKRPIAAGATVNKREAHGLTSMMRKQAKGPTELFKTPMAADNIGSEEEGNDAW